MYLEAIQPVLRRRADERFRTALAARDEVCAKLAVELPLAEHFGCQQDALLVEKFVAGRHQLLFFLEREVGAARHGRVARQLSHELLLRARSD